MAKVYTTTPGHTVRIGNHGVATNDQPCIVPDEIADELELDMKGEKAVEPIEADPEKGIKAVEGKPARAALGPIYRIERDGKAPPPRLSAAAVRDAQKVKE